MKNKSDDEAMSNLVIAVSPDSSLDLLRSFADIIVLDKDQTASSDKAYDTVYIRSHFGQESTLPQNFRGEIESFVQRVKSLNPQVVFVDGMDNVDHIVTFEDKWRQYDTFGAYMPRTEPYTDDTQTTGFTRPIFKKRLSSRGVGVTWDASKANVSAGEWLIQESIDIAEELRVYVICGQVHPVGAVKRSMEEGGRSQAINFRTLTPDELEFSSQISNLAPELDMIGLDIARTPDGTLRLMEVNRSPGFAKFEELTGVNLASILYQKLGI